MTPSHFLSTLALAAFPIAFRLLCTDLRRLRGSRIGNLPEAMRIERGWAPVRFIDTTCTERAS